MKMNAFRSHFGSSHFGSSPKHDGSGLKKCKPCSVPQVPLLSFSTSLHGTVDIYCRVLAERICMLTEVSGKQTLELDSLVPPSPNSCKSSTAASDDPLKLSPPVAQQIARNIPRSDGSSMSSPSFKHLARNGSVSSRSPRPKTQVRSSVHEIGNASAKKCEE